jgi:competence protein ComEA
MLFLKLAALFSLAAVGSAQSLPEGPGKAVTERMCKPCHGLENVVREKRTKDRWAEIVDDMVSRGAQGTDAEIDQVIDYLVANFGANAARMVNVNKAEASELSTTLGLSAADSDAIVHYRAEKGAFKSIQDLMKVPGIDVKKIESVQNRIAF